MRFFIDFEGTQFSQEIISVGVVAEDGETFYSTVKPKTGKINNFITKLTGLTKEEINKAPTADEVFEKLWNWIMEKAYMSNANFFVYGGQDFNFVQHTIKNCESYFANMCLCRILGNLKDYSKIVTHTFHLKKDISLTKILSSFRGEQIKQKHNALEDALFLKELVNYVEDETVQLKMPIEQKYYTEPYLAGVATIDRPCTSHYFAFGIEFNSLKDAAMWIWNNKLDAKNRQKVKLNNIAKKIEKRISDNEPYFGVDWRKA